MNIKINDCGKYENCSNRSCFKQEKISSKYKFRMILYSGTQTKIRHQPPFYSAALFPFTWNKQTVITVSFISALRVGKLNCLNKLQTTKAQEAFTKKSKHSDKLQDSFMLCISVHLYLGNSKKILWKKFSFRH